MPTPPARYAPRACSPVALGGANVSHVGPDAVPRGGDASDLLDELVSHRLPAAVLREAHAAGAREAAVYVIDIDGSCLIKLDGETSFPERLQAPLAVGPELPPETFDEVQDIVASKIPDARMTPLYVRDRALGLLVTCGAPTADLHRLAEGAGVALELVSGYTDVVHRARRRKDINAAGEIQQDLLPPRIATVAGAHLAGGVLPGYQVGGDFFDYAENDGPLAGRRRRHGQGQRGGRHVVPRRARPARCASQQRHPRADRSGRPRCRLRRRRAVSVHDRRVPRLAPREQDAHLDQLRTPPSPDRGRKGRHRHRTRR